MTHTLKTLTTFEGISGREHAVREYMQSVLKDAPAVESIETDRIGNCIVKLKGEHPAKHTVVLAAHMDEVGGIVTGITDDGYLRFDTVGGIVPSVLYARRVSVNGHIGVIGGKAIHHCKDKEIDQIPTVAEMRIDIGATDRKQAETVVAVGDAIHFASEYTELHNDRFYAKALDDRAGCAMLLRLAQTKPAYDVTIAFTVQEEVGLRGAAVAGNVLQPEYVVVVDATTAADTGGVPQEKQVCKTGDGPVVSFMDKRTLYDQPLYQHIRALATEHGIPSQTKTVIAGGNDAGTFQTAGLGSRVAAVSLPCRYIHSPACSLSMQDVENTERLLSLLMNTLPQWDGNV